MTIFFHFSTIDSLIQKCLIFTANVQAIVSAIYYFMEYKCTKILYIDVLGLMLRTGVANLFTPLLRWI